ncbi:MAG: 23S rRNA pseudouridine(955/2504/2580) synthase [Gammaproteobacteria bacterium CG_4_10_14_0_8_um_filter_38_16]|nr:MAG: 23S rRNA pseudouridine(955/2504/2580) synthase [Gammaproteobacteria bacterium CG_4_10_14_0_8_um_filter_38_16]PJA03626.1 MAG: 23S rRNA pseudouridine(955/2504/2580) synthase [Gammaproteobacteria bacterium CG_4_10_14_0_2_um_filter_38_22]PJB10428.1 MAG: 23S rRNA pseudouridine(955/2504/2580) synthase [Gammaproteobacteria bacterium CG_4_9_14_3_um_filter_38_9]
MKNRYNTEQLLTPSGKPLQTKFVTIDESHVGQRIDNFLINQLKGVPHSRIYRALRKGEVRVNKGRVQAVYRLKMGDSVRLPPLRVSDSVTPTPSARLGDLLKESVIFENNDFIVLNKPAGLAVHGGSEVACGLIEAFRYIRPDIKDLSLVHRLDRDTSGCLLLAKNRTTLLAFQALQKTQAIQKNYLLLVKGHWSLGKKRIKLALTKNKLQDGERMVIADDEGKPSETWFEPVNYFDETTLLRATLVTGRTHQIRVHVAHVGYPIVGDVKYGDRDFNRQFIKQYRSKRLFLHAEKLVFSLPTSKKPYTFIAPVADDFENIV